MKYPWNVVAAASIVAVLLVGAFSLIWGLSLLIVKYTFVAMLLVPAVIVIGLTGYGSYVLTRSIAERLATEEEA